jgi:hypothetical protein
MKFTYSEARRYYRGEKDKDNMGVTFGFVLMFSMTACGVTQTTQPAGCVPR